MYLLIRRISPYTYANILLGAFADVQSAEKAKSVYIARYNTQPEADPWRNQAYKAPGVADDDLVIDSLPPAVMDATEVFVVSHYSEGFGQVLRQFDSIYESEQAAKIRIAQLEAGEERFPHYAHYQRVEVGILLSDALEDQPDI